MLASPWGGIGVCGLEFVGWSLSMEMMGWSSGERERQDGEDKDSKLERGLFCPFQHA